MRSIWLILMFLIGFSSIVAQTPLTVDSLKNEIKEANSDSLKVRLLIELALEYKISDTAKAFDYLWEAYEISHENEYSRGLGLFYKNMGNIKSYHGDYRNAIKNFERARLNFLDCGDKYNTSDITVDEGNAYLYLSEYSVAMKKYESALKSFKELKNSYGMARCLNNIGILNKNFGEYALALENYNEIVDIYKKLNDNASLSDAYINIGNVYVMVGEYDMALSNYNKALDVAVASKNNKLQGIALMNSGVIHNKLGNYFKALKYYEKALAINKEINNKADLSKCLTNIGTNYLSMGRYELAEQYINEGLVLKKELGDLKAISNSYDFLAEIHFFREEYDKAIKLGQDAVDLKRNIKDPAGLARCFNNLSRNYWKKSDYKNALRYIDSSLHYASKIGMLEQIVTAYNLSKEIYKETEDYKTALAKAELYKIYSDSLFNESRAKAIYEIESKYHIQELETENEKLRIKAGLNNQILKRNKALISSAMAISFLFASFVILLVVLQRRQRQYGKALQKKNQIITRQNLKLDSHNRTKDKILSVITHDIRGTIGNQLTALSILSREEFKSQEERQLVFSRLANSASLSLDLLENLMQWTKLQEGQISFRPEQAYCNEVIEEVLETFNAPIENKELTLIREEWAEIPCYFDKFMMKNVFKNLLSNAIKFSNRGGEIEIKIEPGEEKIVITVSDKGIGISRGEIAEITKGRISRLRRGTENEKGSGLGLSLTNSYLEFHGTALILESVPNKGTTASFVIDRKRPL